MCNSPCIIKLLAPFSLALSGLCTGEEFTISESLNIDKKGRGNVFLTYAFPNAEDAAEGHYTQTREVIKEIQQINGVASFDMQWQKRGKGVICVVSAEFENCRALGQVADALKESTPRQNDSRSPFKDLVTFDWSLKGINTVEITRKLSSDYPDSSMVFLYTLPAPPDYSNAHHTGREGTLLAWNFKPGDENRALIFTLSPWYILPQNTVTGVGGILAGAIAATLFTLIRRRNRAKTSSQKT